MQSFSSSSSKGVQACSIRFGAELTIPWILAFPCLLKRFGALRLTDSFHKYALRNIRCRTNQYSRSFIPNNVELWNSLDNMFFMYPIIWILLNHGFLFIYCSLFLSCTLGVFEVTGSVHFVFHLCSAIRFVCHLCSNIVYCVLPCDWLYIADMYFPSNVQFTSVIIIIKQKVHFRFLLVGLPSLLAS